MSGLERYFAACGANESNIVPERLCTGNVSFRRALYERVGGFDLTLRRCEDKELGIRFGDGGARFGFAHGADTLHDDVPMTAERWLGVAFEYGQADVAIGHLHPEIPAASPWQILANTFAPARAVVTLLMHVPALMRPAARMLVRVGTILSRVRARSVAIPAYGVAHSLTYFAGVVDAHGGAQPGARGAPAVAGAHLPGPAPGDPRRVRFGPMGIDVVKQDAGRRAHDRPRRGSGRLRRHPECRHPRLRHTRSAHRVRPRPGRTGDPRRHADRGAQPVAPPPAPGARAGLGSGGADTPRRGRTGDPRVLLRGDARGAADRHRTPAHLGTGPRRRRPGVAVVRPGPLRQPGGRRGDRGGARQRRPTRRAGDGSAEGGAVSRHLRRPAAPRHVDLPRGEPRLRCRPRPAGATMDAAVEPRMDVSVGASSRDGCGSATWCTTSRHCRSSCASLCSRLRGANLVESPPPPATLWPATSGGRK